MNHQKYRPYQFFVKDFAERTWPSKTVEKAPVWCSVDLRDGNQALPVPMGIETKIVFFKMLKQMGFKEIEVGFPSASETEYNFLRRIIEDGLVDDDISVQVLTQAREHLIAKSFEALKGVKKAIVHVYNSTSVQQREVVFGKSKEEIVEIAREGAALLNKYAAMYPETEFTFEYSPESFTGTEPEYALEVCKAVMDVWKPTPQRKMIINLPATVEMATPNVYADQVEWFSRNIPNRDSVLISIHTHNDRGTGVAASELALLAGADRIEGTLFGNGERTGNVDILVMAMNLFTQGIDPGIRVGNIDEIVSIYEECTGMTVHDRHPYAGKLVYTAFSGSHQDAIRKGLLARKDRPEDFWDVPYLPIDPADVGREYEAIIRINSQSGKGGVAYILESEFGYKLPKAMHPEAGAPVQKVTDETGKELAPSEIFGIFQKEFVNRTGRLELVHYTYEFKDGEEERVKIKAEIKLDGETLHIKGHGNGPVSAFFEGLQKVAFEDFRFLTYEEHALGGGASAQAAAYIQLENGAGVRRFGVGTDSSIDSASIRAIVSAINRF
ncbi:2-isopropylmalate synthase [Anaerotalea alkaliphila]|uniref:2-isopropylmalate synthase n=1 Tax=Anaerotalea alkaliphila TaxID=2662126 RepID=A0A7X5HW69_9FIRM|nr:2-isopropylmalate synthase [Anaerotalea alkaliphila]NDL67765.1 2-isopropylmalate synthase [Anaerotalea alkaliphila]